MIQATRQSGIGRGVGEREREREGKMNMDHNADLLNKDAYIYRYDNNMIYKVMVRKAQDSSSFPS